MTKGKTSRTKLRLTAQTGLISINQTKKDAINSDKEDWAELCEWKPYDCARR